MSSAPDVDVEDEAYFRVRQLQAFVMTAEDVVKLDNAIRSGFTEVKYVVRFSDKVEVTYTDLSKVLALENSPRRRIRRIQFWSHYRPKNQGWQQAIVTFDDEEIHNISLELKAPHSVISGVSQLIEERIEAMKPRYSWIAHPFVRLVICATVGLAFFMAFGAIGIGLAQEYVFWGTKLGQSILGIAIPFSAFGIALLIFGLGGKLCPPGMFAIGQGLKRHEDLGKYRDLLVGFVVLGIVANVIGALIYS